MGEVDKDAAVHHDNSAFLASDKVSEYLDDIDSRTMS